MSKTSRKISNNRRPNRNRRSVRRPRRIPNFKNYKGSLSIHFGGNQWRTFPDLANGCYLCPLPTGYGVSLRGHDIAPILEKGIAEITIYQPTMQQCKYRIAVVNFLSPFTLPNVIYQPRYLSFMTEPCASQNVFSNSWLRPVDQTVQLFTVVSDMTVLLDTSVGIDSISKTFYIKIPRIRTRYTVDDTSGAVTTMNGQCIFMFTDAPDGDPLYYFDFAMDRNFQAQY